MEDIKLEAIDEMINKVQKIHYGIDRDDVIIKIYILKTLTSIDKSLERIATAQERIANI